MMSKARVLWLGLLAMVLVGAFASAPAYAGGPFWYHSNDGGKTQAKISSQSPETFKGKGGVQILKGTLNKEKPTEVELESENVEAEGEIYNTQLQGQVKIILKYATPKLLKPELKECKVSLGQVNTVRLYAELAWTWDGTPGQLTIQPQFPTQLPDLIFLPVAQQQGAETLPSASFTTITFSGSGCGVLIGTFKVEGSEVGAPTPKNIGEWSKELNIKTAEGTFLQHFWNGKKYVGVKVGLLFGGNPASLIGETKVAAPNQEIAVLEN
jgi:hypothetical protein